MNFNPPTPRGVGPPEALPHYFPPNDFNPPTPRGVGPGAAFRHPRPSWNFNPPTPRGVGLACLPIGDNVLDFNPPTPRGVGLLFLVGLAFFKLFQSTHPAWGGTKHADIVITDDIVFQSTHPAWGGTLSTGTMS